MSHREHSHYSLRTAVVACCAGLLILAVCFKKSWPAASWTVLPKAQLTAKARQIASGFGLDVIRWKASVATNIDKPLAYYAQRHSSEPDVHSVSPLSLRFTFEGKDTEENAEVWLDSSGNLLRWRPPKNASPQNGASLPESELAGKTFRLLAGNRSASFGNPVRTPGDEPHQEQYVWKTTPLPHGMALRERIKIVTEGPLVRSADHTVAFSAEEEEKDADSGDNQGYWEALDVTYGILCTTVIIAVFWIYMVWRARRAINHKFPLRVAAAALVFLALQYVASSINQSARPEHGGETLFSALFLAGVLLCLVATGRGISARCRGKWFALEEFSGLAPVAKPAGHALAAGLLYSPLLLAIPFGIACGLLPGAYVLASQTPVLYSSMPLLYSIDVSGLVYLIGFFGFAVPALRRLFRKQWSYWLVVPLLGLLFFAERLVPVVTGSLPVPLMAGLCSWAIFTWVYKHYDLLAVLVLQLSSTLLFSAFILVQKGFGAWSLWAAIACLAGIACFIATNREPVAHGDALATVPPLIGFRAEREKLKAEFSVARRAQQDMLPRRAPRIEGYSIAASCTPSLEVGGDLYDFLKLPDGRIGIGVADVSGKGVPAALYMTLTKGLLVSITRNNSHLEKVVEEINRHLHGVTRKKVFVTMALGFLDTGNRVLECARAGHNPLVWRQRSRNTITLVSPGGLGLGITAGRIFATQLKVAEMALTEGDTVVFYSDGITEAMNSALEQFGEQRLMDAVQKTDDLDAEAAHDSILRDVKEFLGGVHPQDDMTLVVLRVGAQT